MKSKKTSSQIWDKSEEKWCIIRQKKLKNKTQVKIFKRIYATESLLGLPSFFLSPLPTGLSNVKP